MEDCRVTRLGNFWKFLAQNLNSKVAKMFVDFLCYFEKHNSLLKTAVATFWDNFWKNLGYFLFQHLVTLELREENITKLLFRLCIFLKMGQPRPLIIYFWSFHQTSLQFWQQIYVKNVHLVYGAGIRTHCLWSMVSSRNN